MINKRYIYASFFIALFLCLKVVDLHTLFEGEDHDDHCELCLVSTSVNLDPFLLSDISSIENHTLNFNTNNTKQETTPFLYSTTLLEGLILTRPPPRI